MTSPFVVRIVFSWQTFLVSMCCCFCPPLGLFVWWYARSGRKFSYLNHVWHDDKTVRDELFLKMVACVLLPLWGLFVLALYDSRLPLAHYFTHDIFISQAVVQYISRNVEGPPDDGCVTLCELLMDELMQYFFTGLLLSSTCGTHTDGLVARYTAVHQNSKTTWEPNQYGLTCRKFPKKKKITIMHQGAANASLGAIIATRE